MTEPAHGDDTTSSRAIETARRVLALEAEALGLLADSLGAPFAQAVETMLGVEGRVIVSGMGKSGHVARKIAATFASTGTPAQFVHPAEASHGDLGMVTARDAALVLSNSGETRELDDIVRHTRRFGIPLIGVASNAQSALLTAADIALALPKAREACSVGLAPTTSTTMTMALGDALAVALMERHDFTPERFRMFHPGGKLGAQLVRVADIMATGEAMPLVAQATPMAEALIEMSAKGFGAVGTLDAAGRLAGVITDGDLRRKMDGLLERSAGEVATPDPRIIGPDALVQEALALMTEELPRITTLFVCEAGEARRPVGILHVHQILQIGVGGA